MLSCRKTCFSTVSRSLPGGRLFFAAVLEFVGIGNRLCDFLRLFPTDQLLDEREAEGDRRPEAAAGRDIAVDVDEVTGDVGAGQLVLKAGVGGGVFAFQQAQRTEDAGGGADGRDDLAGFVEGEDRLFDQAALSKVGGAGEAAR